MIGPSLPIAQELHAAKYRDKNETFDDYCVRYARAVADNERHFRPLLAGLRNQRILPAGRQQLAVGRPYQLTAMNCYVGGAINDSIDGIFNSLKEAAQTMRTGGGIGYDFSTLRPSGDPVRGLGKMTYAKGPVSFMHVWNAMSNTILSAGDRQGAMMAVLRVDHPDIMSFINAKADDKSLNNFNISVAVTDDFMEAVDADGLYELKFNGSMRGEARAVDVWARIMERNWDYAEPGVFFVDTVNKMNPLHYCEQIAAPNPCFTGDTLVWTAEGHVSFRTLARRKAPVSVLSVDASGKFVYRAMRDIRRTQRKAALVEVTLMHGRGKRSVVRCTPEHVFYTTNGQEIQARHLTPKTRLHSVHRRPRGGKGYVGLNSHIISMMEHHVPFENVAGLGIVVDAHHLDDNKANNRPNNLELIPHGMYASLHISGDNNPMRRFLDRNVFYIKNLNGAKNPSWRDDLDIDAMRTMRESGLSFMAIAQKLSCSKYTVMHRLGWRRPNNHRVVSVRHLIVREDVYCGTVEETHKFFISTGNNDGVLVHNCGEQPLPPYGACLLLSINMAKHVVPAMTGSSMSIDMEQVEESVELSVRACDNVIDITHYPLTEQKQQQQEKRRMGIGVTGIANAIEACGHRYGTPEYLDAQDAILMRIRDIAYKTSIQLAKEKGSFPMFDADRWLASGFASTLPGDIRVAIEKHGLRNSLLLSLAPAGTISLAADNVSSGIEPVFAHVSKRKVRMPDGPVEIEVPDYGYANFGVKGRTAMEVPPEEHIDVMCRAQYFIDSAVTKTVNVFGEVSGQPAEGHISYSDFKDLYTRAYHGGAKGCTTFNNNGKRAGIMTEGAACRIDENGNRTCGD